MERVTAWVVLGLGTLVLLGGAVGVVRGLRDGDGVVAVLARLLVVLVVVLAMRRAARKVRAAGRS